MNRLARQISQIVLITLTLAFLAGCGKSLRDVVKSLRPQYEAFCKQLADLAAVDTQPLRPAAPLEPKPVMKEHSLESNTAIFMFEQLKDPTVDLYLEGKPDMQLSNPILTQIKIALSPDDKLSGKVSKDFEKNLAAPLAVRYIGMIKVLEHQPPVLATDKSFQGGFMKGMVVLLDRQTMKVVFADTFAEQSDAEVRYEIRNRNLADPQGWLKSNLAGKVRKAVIKKLTEATGGTFEFTTNW